MSQVCYANPNPTYYPAMRLISAITQSRPAIITTTFAHGYITGIIVRLDVPTADGMQQINRFVGAIIVTGDTTFTMDIDSSSFDVFAIPSDPSPVVNICAQVVPIGEVNSILTAATQNILPR